MSRSTSQFVMQPLHFGWAALHSKPKGIVVFIGGAFFGSFPTFFYRAFLQSLHGEGYTIVALPFRFSFRHWDIAISLAKYQKEFKYELLAEARRLGYAEEIYREDPGSDSFNYIWVGHSLGCKYLSLLELLSEPDEQQLSLNLKPCLDQNQQAIIASSVAGATAVEKPLLNQPSVLLDPVISDLDNAVPLKVLQRLLDRWIKVKPSREETFCLIGTTRLFNLTSLVSFESQLASITVHRLIALLSSRLRSSILLRLRAHLAILGWHSVNPRIVSATIEGIDRLAALQMASTTTTPVAR